MVGKCFEATSHFNINTHTHTHTHTQTNTHSLILENLEDGNQKRNIIIVNIFCSKLNNQLAS